MDQIRQAQKDRVVIGLAGTGSNLPRLEIDEMIINQPDTFNLFCLAMGKLKSGSAKDWMGYYQIAGIHGLPLDSWDGVDAADKIARITASRNAQGYCPHGDLKFPTWHRPYIAMMEQTVYLKMHDIAEQFPASVKDTYRKAADAFRFPYWDWHRPRSVISKASGISGPQTKTYSFKAPKIFTEQQIMVKKPSNNELAPMDNPFTYFAFPKEQDGGLTVKDFTVNKKVERYSRDMTKRHPLGPDYVDTLDEALNKALDPSVRNIVNMITNPRLHYDNFDAFGWNGVTRGPSGSLEGIHNAYHLTIGGHLGHVSEVLLSAFDPIFWFHHCNIDRLFAIWQSIYPDSWHEGGNLLPFRAPKKAASSQYWTSQTARYTESFGYIYSDAKGAPEKLQKNFYDNYQWAIPNSGVREPPSTMMPLEEKINRAQVFQPQSLISSISKTVASIPSALLASAVSAPSLSSVLVEEGASQKPFIQPSSQQKQIALQRTLRKMDDDEVATAASSAMDESKVDREWYIDNAVERLALNGTFTIYFFVGGVPGDDVSTAQYLIYPTLAGYTHIFAAPVEACDNCGQQGDAGQKQSDTVPMNRILLDHKIAGHLANLSPNRVEPFLISNLRWRVVDAAARIVDPRRVAGLQIGISSVATAIDGSGGIGVEEYPQVVQQIIEQSS